MEKIIISWEEIEINISSEKQNYINYNDNDKVVIFYVISFINKENISMLYIWFTFNFINLIIKPENFNINNTIREKINYFVNNYWNSIFNKERHFYYFDDNINWYYWIEFNTLNH